MSKVEGRNKPWSDLINQELAKVRQTEQQKKQRRREHQELRRSTIEAANRIIVEMLQDVQTSLPEIQDAPNSAIESNWQHPTSEKLSEGKTALITELWWGSKRRATPQEEELLEQQRALVGAVGAEESRISGMCVSRFRRTLANQAVRITRPPDFLLFDYESIAVCSVGSSFSSEPPVEVDNILKDFFVSATTLDIDVANFDLSYLNNHTAKRIPITDFLSDPELIIPSLTQTLHTPRKMHQDQKFARDIKIYGRTSVGRHFDMHDNPNPVAFHIPLQTS